MNPPSKEELGAVGLPVDLEPTPAGTFQLPRPAAQHALSSAIALDDIEARFDADPETEELLELTDRLATVVGAVVVRLWAPGRCLLIEGTVAVRGPSVVLLHGEAAAVPTQAGRTVVGVSASGGEAAVVVDDAGHVSIWELSRPASAALDPLRGFKAPAPPELQAPDPSAIAGEVALPEWLLAVYEARCVGGPLGVACAVAALGAYAPNAPLPRDASPEACLAAVDDGPIARARRWAASLPAELLAAVMHDATRDAAALQSDLEELERAALAEGPDAASVATVLALDWLHRRDDLACLYDMLAPLGGMEMLHAAVDQLDRAAAEAGSVWSLIGSIHGDPRLRRASWIRPDAYWAVLALD